MKEEDQTGAPPPKPKGLLKEGITCYERQRYVPLQRQLAPEEALTILRDYQQRHPWIFRQCTRLFGFPYDGTDESLVTLSRAIPGMAFRPSQQE